MKYLIFIIILFSGCYQEEIPYRKFKLKNNDIVYCKLINNNFGEVSLYNCKDGNIYRGVTDLIEFNNDN